MKRRIAVSYAVILGLSLLLAGCVTKPSQEAESASEFPPPLQSVDPARSAPLEEPAGVLRLQQALALSLKGHPDLVTFSWDLRIGEARLLQAGLRPNPEAGLEIENVLGTGEFRSAREAETTLQLGQLIELGGKRAARMRAASVSRDLAAWDYETARIAVLTATAEAFVEVLSLQQRRMIADDFVGLAEQAVETVEKRVKAARTFAVEGTKARVALATVRIERDQVSRSLEAARLRLAASWGSTETGFERVEGDLETLGDVPQLERLQERVEKNPDIARWATEVLQREANLELERTRRVPDITVGAGYRRLNGPDDNAFLAGVSIPLPFFNQNQGGIREAEYRLAKVQAEQAAAGLRVRLALSQAWQRLSAAHAEVVAIKESVLPGAEQTFASMNEYLAEGRLDFLEVLDAQRTLGAARAQYFRALNDYHRAVLTVERLIGEPLSSYPSPE